MISQLIGKFQLDFINNETYSHVYFDSCTNTSTSKNCKAVKPLSNNSNKIIVEFNRYIKESDRDFSTVVITPFISQLRPSMKSDSDSIVISITIKHLDSGYQWFSKSGYQFDFGVICIPKKSAIETAAKQAKPKIAIETTVNVSKTEKNSNMNSESTESDDHVAKLIEKYSDANENETSNDDKGNNNNNYSNSNNNNELMEMNSILDKIVKTMDNLNTLKKGSSCSLQTFTNFLNSGKYKNPTGDAKISDCTHFLWNNYFFSDLNAANTGFYSKLHPLKSSGSISALLKTTKFEQSDQINICFDFKKSVTYAQRIRMQNNDDDDNDDIDNYDDDIDKTKCESARKKVVTIIGKEDTRIVTGFENGEFKLEFDKFYYLLAIASARQGQPDMGNRKGFVFEIGFG